MATKALAEWAIGLQYSQLSQSVVDAATTSLYNWAGCAIGGYMQSAPMIALNVTTPFSGPGTSNIYGANASTLLDAQTAAFINGIASHVDDYDDTHLETIIHPTGPVASALFAEAERHDIVPGADFITAFVAGVEAECKLGLSVYPEHYDVGWHITSTTGSIGAAVAVGKFLGLELDYMQQAIGIASTQVTGMQEYFGSDTKSFHIGRAAQNGLLAALLAQNGYTSSSQGLEAEYGWANVVSTRENLTDEFATLGKTWEIEKNTFKPFPCGIVLHPIIDGCIQIHDKAVQKGLNESQLGKIEARVSPQVMILTGKTDPKTGLEGKFSVYHAAAVALLFGKATPQEFTDDVVRDETVIATRKTVNTIVDDTLQTDQARLHAVYGNGETIELFVDGAVGSLKKPLTVKQLKTKFIDQVSRVIGQGRAEKAYEAFKGVASLDNIRDIYSLYTPGDECHAIGA